MRIITVDGQKIKVSDRCVGIVSYITKSGKKIKSKLFKERKRK